MQRSTENVRDAHDDRALPDGDRETLNLSFDTAALDRLRRPAAPQPQQRGPRVATDASVAQRVGTVPAFVADVGSDAW
ncbi:MAG: hypothetical protein M5U31_13535 [Acidimicrobiia bacterium]|nr:hypothetical protein [Acidimicrobiia bacterium]